MEWKTARFPCLNGPSLSEETQEIAQPYVFSWINRSLRVFLATVLLKVDTLHKLTHAIEACCTHLRPVIEPEHAQAHLTLPLIIVKRIAFDTAKLFFVSVCAFL